MLAQAVSKLGKGEHPVIHSDRGCHYRWPGWISRMDQAGLERSMSKKGCSPDNSACEGLFGRLKNEMFYSRDWTGVSIREFIDILNEYLVWYNSLGKYQIQGRRKEQLYTKDKTALNVILSDCTRLRTFSQYVYGGSIFHS